MITLYGIAYCCQPDLQKAVEQLKDEKEKLKEFAHHVIRFGCWALFDQDGGDIQELAEKLGLKELKQLKAEVKKLKTELNIKEQCDKCKFTNPKGPATCPSRADGELPCAGFEQALKGE